MEVAVRNGGMDIGIFGAETKLGESDAAGVVSSIVSILRGV